MNWIINNKILAFSSPISSNKNKEHNLLEPESYISLFKEWKIKLVIRLNKKCYDSTIFTDAGIDHLDLYFPDGSIPSTKIMNKFLMAVENTNDAVAVHCRAGLGRTGTLIGIYLMKHYGFSGSEVIAFLRFMRPGSVLGI